MSRAPSLTAVVVLTMGVAIGTTTAIFSVVDGVLLRPFPYPEPDRLAHVTVARRVDGEMRPSTIVSAREFGFFASHVREMEPLGGYRTTPWTLVADGTATRLSMAVMTVGAFEAVGVEPVLGRLPGVEDIPADFWTRWPVVISWDLWMGRFGGDPDILGRVVRTEGRDADILGVMPRGFEFPDPDVQIWGLITLEGAPNVRFLNMVGRLAPGATPSSAEAEFAVLIPRLTEAGLSEEAVRTGYSTETVIRPFKETVVEEARLPLTLLLWASLGVLVVACANVANLLLVRAEARSREHALRRALGSARGRLIRLVLLESLILGLVGALLGVGLAYGGTRLLLGWAPAQGIPRVEQVAVDRVVLLFTLGTAVAASLLAGLLPALRAGSSRALASLRDGGRGVTVSRRRQRLRGALVVGQIAVALLLTVTSGLLVRSYRALTHVDPGFDPEGVLTFTLSLPVADYPTGEAVARFHERMQAELLALPGVTRVGGIDRALPLGATATMSRVTVPGHPALGGGADMRMIRRTLPGYFETMNIPLLEGRDFTPEDHREPLPSIIISESMKDLFWPDESALGKEMMVGSTPGTVVGVVGDVLVEDLTGSPRPVVYRPIVDKGLWATFDFFYVVRGTGDPAARSRDIRALVARVAPMVPMAELRPARELVDQAMARTTFIMALLLVAASISVLLGMVGVYAVLSYVARQRTAEIGIRMVLGASRDSIKWLLLGSGIRLAVGGVALGLLMALLAGRAIRSLLFGVGPIDVLTLLAGTTLVLAVGVVASVAPAVHASRTSPAAAVHAD